MGIVFLNKQNFWKGKKFFVQKGIVQKKRTMDEQNGSFRETNLKNKLIFQNFTEPSFSEKRKEIDGK